MTMPKLPALMDQAADPAAPGATGSAPVSEPAAGTLLANSAPAETFDWIPEKFRVAGQDGAVDVAQSARKIEEHRSNLEKRLGSGDIPPKTADEYKVEVPEPMADKWKQDDPIFGEFKAFAHDIGLSQLQFAKALPQFLEFTQGIGGGVAQLDAEAARTELSSVWKGDALNENLSAANRAVLGTDGLASQDAALAERLNAKYGNDPDFVQFAAFVGRAMREDKPPAQAVSAAQTATVEQLMAGEAYKNPKHPEHAAVSAQVAAYYAAKAKASPASVF